MRKLRTAVGVLLGAAAVLLGVPAAAHAAGDTAPPGTPTAVHTTSVPTAGPLFFGPLAGGHGCSASVVHSPGHDLVVTAAHCIRGTGAGIRFAPGYLDGTTPEGVWVTTRVYLDPAWIRTQDPQHDYAFLVVAPQRVGSRVLNVEDVTGANLLGFAPRVGTRVTDPAYPAGVDDAPISCTAAITYTSGYPTFDCYGYLGGTSGSPFLQVRHRHPATVVGVIGGLNQGGCYDWNSFSSAFGLDTYRVYLRAVLRLPADNAPAAGSDGC